jgi:catechol 2,3-dioxygenase-like lactoylglutathione lyase family enzyme
MPAAGYFAAMSDLLSLKTRLSTPFLVETRTWYCDLFNLNVLEEWDEPADQGCILGLPGTAAGAFIEIYHCAALLNFAGISLQFRVDDVAGFAVPEGPRFKHQGPIVRPWGSQYLFFRDPNGVSVVVFSGTSL